MCGFYSLITEVDMLYYLLAIRANNLLQIKPDIIASDDLRISTSYETKPT